MYFSDLLGTGSFLLYDETGNAVCPLICWLLFGVEILMVSGCGAKGASGWGDCTCQ